MMEGGITGWKKKEGDAFSTGEVLLEIETDKATIDVEAQEDGIVGKILLQDGAKNVPVGKIIALLAEEGDDISNLQPPKEENLTPQKKHLPRPYHLRSNLPNPLPRLPSHLCLCHCIHQLPCSIQGRCFLRYIVYSWNSVSRNQDR